MTTADIHTLTGAYALNALTDTERDAFERHLRECEGCALEVRELRATATQLGLASAVQPPEELKQRVLAAIAGTRQLPPEVAEDEADSTSAPVIPLRARRWPMRAALAAAAAAVVLAGVFGATTYDSHQRLQQAQVQIAAISSVLGAPDARTFTTAGSATGASGRFVVSRSEDRAVFLASGLPPIPAGRSYQAWMIGEHGPVSMGLLSAESDSRMQPVLATGLGDTDKIGVTVEPSGGSRQPTTSPVLLLSVS